MPVSLNYTVGIFISSGLGDMASTGSQVHFLLATCGNDNLIKLWDIVAFAGSASKFI